MAKGYHVLAGVCRDIRNAIRDAAQGSATAAQLVDDFNDVLDLLDDGCDGALPERQEGDEPALGDDAEDEDLSLDGDEPVARNVRSVGVDRQRPMQLSTRARAQQERRRGVSPSRQMVMLPGADRRGKK